MAWVGAVLTGSFAAALPHLLQVTAGLSYQAAYRVAFLGMVALGVLATAVVLPVREDRSAFVARPSWLPRQSGGRIALLALTLGTLGLGLGFIVQLLPLWFHLRFHVSEAFLGPWYGLMQVLALGTLALATPLSRRLGAVPFVVLTQGMGSAFLILMAFAPAVSVAIVLWLCRTVIMDASWPVQQAYIMGVVQPDERASASSLSYAAWSIASALTPPVGGALLGAHLYTVPFLLGGVCYAVSIGIFSWFFHSVRPLEQGLVTAASSAGEG
jgi:MFS family permease